MVIVFPLPFNLQEKCRQFSPLVQVKSSVLSKQWQVVESEYDDIWPFSDSEIVGKHYEECLAVTRDETYVCGLMEGIYWPRLLSLVHEWPLAK